jgi:hypothetical protein
MGALSPELRYIENIPSAEGKVNFALDKNHGLTTHLTRRNIGPGRRRLQVPLLPSAAQVSAVLVFTTKQFQEVKIAS